MPWRHNQAVEPDPERLETLKEAIRQTHGGEPVYRETVLVKEMFRGGPAWEAEVGVFLLGEGQCFAFFMPDGTVAAVLMEPPVHTAADAVRVTLV